MARKAYCLVSLLLVASLLLSACQQTPASTTAPTTAPPAATTPGPTGGPAPTTSRPAATTPAAATIQTGGIFRVGTSVPNRQVLPEYAGGMGINNWYHRVAHDTLLRIDENGQLKEFLATAWKIDPQAATITLTLRQGVKFHDGTDFNAQAVKFSWDLRKTEYKNTNFALVKSIDVVDDYTVKISLTKFDNTFVPALWFIPSEISSPTAWQTMGKAKAEFFQVGTGPFRMIENKQDVIVRYERFDGYWQKGKPYLDGFEYRTIADPTTHELMFRRGEVDTAPLDADINQRLFDEKKYQFLPGSLPGGGTFWALTPDSGNANSPWANKKVREAAEYAIDKEKIALAMGGPEAVAMYQWSPPGTYAFIKDIPGARKYNPEKAKQLLSEAGFPNGFPTTHNVGATLINIRDMWVAVHEQWRKVGIDVKYNQLTLPTFLDMSRGGWQNGVLDGAPRVVPDWLAGAIGTFSTTATMSKSMSRPAELQVMMDKARSVSDLAERNKLAKEINQFIANEALMIPVYVGGGIGGSLYQMNVYGVDYYAWNDSSKNWSAADLWKKK